MARGEQGRGSSGVEFDIELIKYRDAQSGRLDDRFLARPPAEEPSWPKRTGQCEKRLALDRGEKPPHEILRFGDWSDSFDIDADRPVSQGDQREAVGVRHVKVKVLIANRQHGLAAPNVSNRHFTGSDTD